MAQEKIKVVLVRNTYVKGVLLEVLKGENKNIHELDRDDAVALIAAKKAVPFAKGGATKGPRKAGEEIDRAVKSADLVKS